MQIGWIYHRRFLDHQTGRAHPECADRLKAIVQALDESGLLGRMCPLPFGPANTDQLALVHDRAYLDILRVLCQEGFTFVGDSATSICEASFDVATWATGGVLAACDAVAKGKIRRAFCAVRPPGHHANAEQATGFCLINHIAVAAEHLLRSYDFERLAIIDLDVHHGHGTQQIFDSRDDVFYVSLHERPESLSFPGSGHDYEMGSGRGRGSTLNIPLDRGCDSKTYLNALTQKAIPALERYEPEFVLVSIGFDALAGERLAHLSLTPESYEPITKALVDLADRCAGGRLVSSLEGGYDLGRLGPAVVSHVRALME